MLHIFSACSDICILVEMLHILVITILVILKCKVSGAFITVIARCNCSEKKRLSPIIYFMLINPPKVGFFFFASCSACLKQRLRLISPENVPRE